LKKLNLYRFAWIKFLLSLARDADFGLRARAWIFPVVGAHFAPFRISYKALIAWLHAFIIGHNSFVVGKNENVAAQIDESDKEINSAADMTPRQTDAEKGAG